MNKTVLYTKKPAKIAKLFIFPPSGQVEEIELTGSCVIGRKTDGSNANIQLDCTITSRKHGEIAVLDGEYYYRDLGSLNGTFVNDVLYGKDAKRAAIKLENGDILRIDKSDSEGRHSQAIVMVFSTAYSEAVHWQLLPLSNNIAEINLGRAADPGGLTLNNEMVSKNHASFFCKENGWEIMDHASTNGVFVNNRRITTGYYSLAPLDVVRIVDIYFIFTGNSLLFQSEQQEHTSVSQTLATASNGGAPLVIHITERSVWQRFKKLTLLQNINLTINSGEMVLILGGSGAGKTTFMNAVMGYEKAEGQIFHGQTDIYNEYEQMKYEIGFVPQQDLLRSSDTVYDTLSNSADMKMPRRTTPAQKEVRIEEVLELFGLQREWNSLVNKLSGGQRKRLSIAVEFIANPSLFFLDEPDSGLDGIMAKSLNENLRIIADGGKIVMVITHSPDRVAHLYNKVIVLAKSMEDNCGHLAYYGSIPGALEFFETDSLEGVVKRINRPDEGGDGKSDFYIKKYEQQIG